MGSFFSAILKRLFQFPIQRKPICYHRQGDFSSCGEPLRSLPRESKAVRKLDIDDFQKKFTENLLRERRTQMKARESTSRKSKTIDYFPGWDETAISNIHSLFLLFNNMENGMINFINFSAILESLGDSNTYEEKRKHFDIADEDFDGWLSYDEFLRLMYFMNPINPETGELQGVAKLCKETAENIKYVTALRVGEQLEYGLF
ncbi:hypothetical protein WA026_001736 [Henosepilachna vigintioctopunctata]|uniref:EF-hand domain-containing protein n=1 Tax=Henosepilachna vigintioctopunctata TaxID=420089 RepID=A0AAW1UVG0_9CUCU